MSDIAPLLLSWYDRHGRDLPWRQAKPEPYKVWLSEVMLQQTTVATVAPYYSAFLARWPTVAALADADLDEVLHAWQGLGYYSRARNLHRCARAVAAAGGFPDHEAGLRALPGIGPYTAAAIAAIAFDRPATVVDGNVERVVARLFAIDTPLPDAKAELRDLAATLTPRERPGDFAQAMMDLGATVCTPRKPACGDCPLGGHCRAAVAGRAADLPVRRPRAARPRRQGIVYWAERADGAVLLVRRPAEGLLGGLAALPTGGWGDTPPDGAQGRREAPVPADWRELPGTVTHVFTHFHLSLRVWRAAVADGPGRWVRPADFGDHALPTVMKKVVRHVRGGDRGGGESGR